MAIVRVLGVVAEVRSGALARIAVSYRWQRSQESYRLYRLEERDAVGKYCVRLRVHTLFAVIFS